MLLPILFTGFILIVAGFLVKRNPNLIAGYNSMTEEQKKNIDINGMSSMMRNYLLLTGIMIILLELAFKKMEIKPYYSILVTFTLIVFVILIMAIHARKYYRS